MSLRRLVASTTALVLAGAMLVAAPLGATAATLPAPSPYSASVVSGDLTLAWRGVAGATAYRVELSADVTFATVLEAQDTYALSYVPRTTLGSIGGGELFWRVAAYESGTSAASRGDWSAVQVTGRSALVAPVPVAPGPGSTIVYPNPTTFQWTSVPGAASYTVRWAANGEFETAPPNQTQTVTSTSFTPPAPLVRDSNGPITWHWRVRANMRSATMSPVVGPESPSRTFTVTWPAASSRPTLLSPANWVSESSPAVSDPLFTWTPVAGAKAYRLVLGKTRQGDELSSIIADVTVTGTSYVHPDTLDEELYFWQVTAVDQNGASGVPSDIRQVNKRWGTQAGPITAAPFPGNRPVATAGSTDLSNPTVFTMDDFLLSWEPMPRATLYEVVVTPLNGTPALTCRTASTTATIIAKWMNGAGRPDALKGSGTCLWSGNVNDRIQPRPAGDGDVAYSWKVRGLDLSGRETTTLQGPSPTGTVMTEWSDPETVGDTDARYFVVRPATAPTGPEPYLDETHWQTQTATSLRGQPAPELRWSPVTGASGYEVEVALASGFSNQVHRFWTPSARLRPTGVFQDNSAGLPYYWRVRAVTANPSWSTFAYVSSYSTALTWSKASTPTDFVGVASPVVTQNGATLISWRPQFLSAPLDGGSRGYQVEVRNASGTPIRAKVEYPFWVAQNPTTGKPLPAGDYSVRVAPLDANGDPGAQSAPREFTVSATQPKSPTAQVFSSGAVLSWTAPAAAERFLVTYWNNATPDTKLQAGKSPTLLQTSATLTDLAPGTYSWRVTSFDAAGNESSPSSVATFTVASRTPAPATVDNTVLASARRVLDWQPVAGASRYLVQLAPSAGALSTAKPVETSATSIAVPDSVSFGTTYYWRVSAIAERASSTQPTLLNSTVLGTSAVRRVSFRTTPLAPRQSRPSVVGSTIVASWTPLTGADAGVSTGLQYVVRYRLKATPERAWTTLPATTTSAIAQTISSGLVIGGSFEIQVAARNSEGQGPWSSAQTIVYTTAPSAPRYPSAKGGDRKVVVRWTVPSQHGGSPISRYLVEHRTYDAKAKRWSAWTTAGSAMATTATTYSYTHQSRINGTKYEYRVRAVNSVARAGGAPSSVVSATAKGKPSAPQGVKVKAYKGKTKVSWKAAASNGSKITAYYVQYSTNGKKWKSIKTAKSSARSYTTKVGKKGKMLYFRVIAKNALGKSPASSVVMVVKK